MSELRIFRKSDGTEVLQEKEYSTVPGSSLKTANFEWKDVPVVHERKMPLRTGKIQSVSGCAGGECGMNGSEFEFVVTHRLSDNHLYSWNDHDLIVNDALPDYRMIIRHAKILLSDNGFSRVKYLVQSYEADPHSYIPKEIFSNYPCLSLYDQEYINSKRRPKNEVVSFGYGGSFNVGNLEIKHFRNENGEQQFDRWKPGQVIANRKNHRRSKMVIRDAILSCAASMHNIVRYRIETIDNDELPVEYVRQGEEFEVMESVIGERERSIPVPGVCEQPSPIAVTNDNELKRAMKVVTDTLISDPGYRTAWMSNMAMVFKDIYDQSKKKDIHKISNEAASYFLHLLCSDRPPSDIMLVEDGVNEVMEFGQFILNKIEGLHCRNVKGWHNDFIEFKIKEKFKKS